jgi:hypothetical protein
VKSTAAWAIFAIVFAVVFLLAQIRPIHDVDIFWQVRLGQIMLDTGKLPAKEPFAATHANEPFVPVGWLAQLIDAANHRVGGWDGLHLFDAALWGMTFALLAWSMRTKPMPAIAISIGLGVVGALPWVSVRPQTFAILCFAAFLILLRSTRNGWLRIALAVPLLVFWQNCHPSVSIAALVAGVAVVVETSRRLFGRRGTYPWVESGLAVLAVAATIATPAGTEIFRIAAVNAALSRELGVDEWLPIWSLGNRASAAPAIAALLIGARFLWANRRTVPATDLAIAVVLLAATVAMIRFQVFWSIALTMLLGRTWPDAAPAPADARPGKWLPAVAAVIVLLACLVSTIGRPLVRPTPFIDHIPLDGVERLASWLKSADVDNLEFGLRPGKLYNHPAWGGPLIFRGWPRWKVAYDGRYYVYSKAEWDEQRRAAAGEVPLSEIDREYRPLGFFLHPLAEAGLVKQLRDSRDWRSVHEDENCVIFVPAH